MSLQLNTVMALAFCALVLGCGSSSGPITSQSTKYEVGDESQTTTADSQFSATSDLANGASITSGQTEPRRPKPLNQAPAAVSNRADMVQATPEQLLGVIRSLREQQPQGNRDEIVANFVEIQSQVIQAVDMLLALKPEDDTVAEAAQAKIDALTDISQLGAEDALDQLFAFTQELEDHPSEKVREFGRRQTFFALLNAFSTDQVTDPQQVMDAFKKLAAEQPKEGGLLTFGRNVASRFIEKGMNSEAAELFRYTAGLVLPTDDPRLRATANGLIEQAKFADLDFGAKLNAVATREEGAIEEFTKVVDELTSGDQPGATTLQTLMQVAGMLEAQSFPAAATRVYDAVEASVDKESDDELALLIKDTIEKYRLRSAIVGKPFALEGKLLDGAPFDWAQYKGKVVLVDFWATWCGPCLQEMPNIRANYEKYRERGFEVVGVNLDDDQKDLEEFSSLQPLPWPSVLSSDPDAVGWEHPMVEKYGVAAIPFLVLVDQEGTAIALNTRGPALGEKLAELFPDSASTSDPPNSTDPPADPGPEPAAPQATEPDSTLETGTSE